MRVLSFLGAVALLRASITSAAILTPGSNAIPEESTPPPGSLTYLDGTVLPEPVGIPGDPSILAVVNMSIYREPAGTLTFFFKLGSPVENPALTLRSIQLAGFAGVDTNVLYWNTDPNQTQLAPISAERSADGDAVRYLFTDPDSDPVPANFPPVAFTTGLLVRTNATSYDIHGSFSAQFSDQNLPYTPVPIQSFAPVGVPEPTTLLALLLAPPTILLRRQHSHEAIPAHNQHQPA
jgi:hypothetical protein